MRKRLEKGFIRFNQTVNKENPDQQKTGKPLSFLN
jgi:hypothetical protein